MDVQVDSTLDQPLDIAACEAPAVRRFRVRNGPDGPVHPHDRGTRLDRAVRRLSNLLFQPRPRVAARHHKEIVGWRAHPERHVVAMPAHVERDRPADEVCQGIRICRAHHLRDHRSKHAFARRVFIANVGGVSWAGTRAQVYSGSGRDHPPEILVGDDEPYGHDRNGEHHHDEDPPPHAPVSGVVRGPVVVVVVLPHVSCSVTSVRQEAFRCKRTRTTLPAFRQGLANLTISHDRRRPDVTQLRRWAVRASEASLQSMSVDHQSERSILMKTCATCVAVLFAAASAAAQGANAQNSRQGTSVSMDRFEQNRNQYVGKEVRLNAAVNNVLGPHLFTINDGNWFDLQGDTLVYLPAPLVGLITEEARVTVTGQVKRFAEVDLDREFDWFDTKPTIEAEISTRPVIVASSIVTDQGMALSMNIMQQGQSAKSGQGGTQQQSGTAGTSGTSDRTETTGASGTSAESSSKGKSDQQITSLDQLTKQANQAIVGREVKLSNARVAQTAEQGRFWIGTQGQEQILVVSTDGKANVSTGQNVRIDGIVLQMPAGMRDSVQARGQDANQQIYVYASEVHPASR